MKLSRKVKGSNNWHKQKIRVARCHAKVSDQRRDFAHKLTTGWAQQHDLIAFENMNVRTMVHGNLAKSIYDAGWGMLRHMCAYGQRNRSHRYRSTCGSMERQNVSNGVTTLSSSSGQRGQKTSNEGRHAGGTVKPLELHGASSPETARDALSTRADSICFKTD